MRFRIDGRLGAFFLIACGLAWVTWLPALAWLHGATLLPLVGLFAPAIAAILVSDRTGRRDLAARIRRWRVPPWTYAVALLLMPACYAAAIPIARLLDGMDTRDLVGSGSVLFLATSFAWLLFVTSGEEIGWRGYALPRLLALGVSPLTASLVLGAAWGLWHLPLYLVPGGSSLSYPVFFALVIGQSLVYTALALHTRGSLIPAVVLHATTDLGARLYHIERFTTSVWLMVDALVAIVGLLLLSTSRSSPCHTQDTSQRARERTVNLRGEVLDAETVFADPPTRHQES
jgi:membrane protease YdiL (CAAX protease family)